MESSLTILIAAICMLLQAAQTYKLFQPSDGAAVKMKPSSKAAVLVSKRKMLTLLAFSVVLFCATIYSVLSSHGQYKPEPTDKQSVIADREFFNEVVNLDGNRFLRCKFHNVTFNYDGRTDFSMDSIDLYGSITLHSNNKAIMNAWALSRSLGLVKPNVDLRDEQGHPNTNFQLPKLVNPRPSMP